MCVWVHVYNRLQLISHTTGHISLILSTHIYLCRLKEMLCLWWFTISEKPLYWLLGFISPLTAECSLLLNDQSRPQVINNCFSLEPCQHYRVLIHVRFLSYGFCHRIFKTAVCGKRVRAVRLKQKVSLQVLKRKKWAQGYSKDNDYFYHYKQPTSKGN